MIAPRSASFSTQAIARHYDELDVFYREIWGEHIHHGLWRTGDEPPEVAVQQLVEAVATAAQIGPGDRVCDVGCGYGGTARCLATLGADVLGLTLSETQRRHAEAASPTGNPAYRVQDWLANDLPDAAFDAVVSIEALEHMADKQRFFDEIARVLRPGGRFAVTGWLAAENPTPWQVRHLLEPICREAHLPALGSAADYQACLARAGLHLDRFADCSRQVRRTWPVCLRRVLLGLFRHPRYLQYLLDPAATNRHFPLTMLRIWLAYHVGAFGYGLFVGRARL